VRGISCITEDLLASREGLCSIELVIDVPNTTYGQYNTRRGYSCSKVKLSHYRPEQAHGVAVG
jgi:hypothetical protein